MKEGKHSKFYSELLKREMSSDILDSIVKIDISVNRGIQYRDIVKIN